MAGNIGLTAAVMAALDSVEWQRCSEVIKRLEPRHHKAAGVILCQKVASGHIEKRGVHRAYEYRLTSVYAKPEHDAGVPLRPQPIWAANLGLVCGAQAIAPDLGATP